MAKRPPLFRQTDVERAVKSVRATGLDVFGVEIGPDGTIRVNTGQVRPDPQPASSFDIWKAKRDAS